MKDNVVLLIPSLNPDGKLIRTVESMIDKGFSKILLVNDGSDKDRLAPFESLALHPEVELIGYETNRGKGYALKYGFAHILKNYPLARGVVTADGDGQHLAADCMRAAELMLSSGEPVFGCRNFKDRSVPFHNRAGNNISVFLYGFFCGVKLSDTQTGLRAFPRKYLEELVGIEGSRFEYETNVILYLKENAIAFKELAIQTVYEEDSNAGSHFKVFSDSVKIYKPILRFGGARLARFFVGSLLSAGIDLGLFTLIGLFWDSIPGATAAARICSSFFNYCFNRGAVFKDSGSAKKSAVRYYILAFCQLCASAALVTLICRGFSVEGLAKTGVKFAVDMLLFLISFFVQREWVFKK